MTLTTSTWRRARRTAALAALTTFLLAAALAPALGLAQEAPRLDVVDITHSPNGTVTLALSRTADGLDPLSVNALLDGVPAEVRTVDEAQTEPSSVVVAIDTSGSMEGAPIEAARAAAFALVARLDPADSVAIVGFDEQAAVLSPFTTDRALTQQVITGLTAQGATSLFDAVQLSAELLAGVQGAGPRALVLLSDGEDSGASTSTADAGLALVAQHGIEVYAFALGSDTDVQYLQQLSATGAYSQVASEQALAALFEALGSQLGATIHVEVGVPPLPLGDHTLELRAMLAGVPVSTSSVFTVDNAGLIAPSIEANEADRMVVNINSAAAPGLLTLRALVDGVEVRPTGEGTLLLDYWSLTPGAHQAEITAWVGDALAASAVLPVEVPALEPQLTAEVDREAVPPLLTVTARVQGTEPGLVRVFADGEQVAEAASDESLEIEAPAGDVTVQLLDAAGLPLDVQDVAPIDNAKAGGGSSMVTILLGLGALAALGGAGYLVLRRRRGAGAPAPLRPVRPRPVRRPTVAAATHESRGVLVLRTPDGDERSVPIGPKPLTLGTSPQCDVVLDSDTIRPVHARVSARSNGEFQVHGVGAASSTPYINERHDEWAVLASGESIAIGDHVITLLKEAETEEGIAHAVFSD